MTKPTYLLTEVQRQTLLDCVWKGNSTGQKMHEELQSLPMVQSEPVAYRLADPDIAKKHHYFDLNEVEPVKHVLEPLYTSPQPLPNETLDELLGQYWDIGYKEGDTREPDGSAANDVLHKIRMLVKPLQHITADDVTDEMLQFFHSQYKNGSVNCNEDEIAAAYNAVIKNRSKE